MISRVQFFLTEYCCPENMIETLFFSNILFVQGHLLVRALGQLCPMMKTIR